MIIWTLQQLGENWAAGGIEPNFETKDQCVAAAKQMLTARSDLLEVHCIKNEVDGATMTAVNRIVFKRAQL